jgi:hypothetical protein
VAEIILEDDVTLTEGQRTTITKAWLDDGKDARVWREDYGWVYVETAAGSPRDGRGDGHLLDEDGDYRFPGGGKVKLEDL